MLIFVTILGFITTFATVFFDGSIRIICGQFFDITYNYTQASIIAFASVLTCMLLYRFIIDIALSPKNMYAGYKVRQRQKSSQMCLDAYAHYLLDQDRQFLTEYANALPYLSDQPVYWALWCSMHPDNLELFYSYRHSDESVKLIHAYYEVKALMAAKAYNQALFALDKIDEHSLQFAWFMRKQVECFVNIEAFDKAVDAYVEYQKSFGSDAKLEASIFLKQASLYESEQALKYYQMAYDSDHYNLDAVKAYAQVLLSEKKYEDVFNVIHKYLGKQNLDKELSILLYNALIESKNVKVKLDALTNIKKHNQLQITVAKVHVHRKEYSIAKEILLKILESDRERVLPILAYIDACNTDHQSAYAWLETMYNA